MKNFEKYKTTEARINGHVEWCNAESRCRYKGKVSCPACALMWLELEAQEKKKPLACPFCGYQIVGTKGTAKGVRLVCACGYSSGEYFTVDEAINAHNRICRAVAAHKESEVK